MANEYERIYSMIKGDVSDLRTKYHYANDSQAFGHLMMTMLLGIGDDEANCATVDGPNDNGIDAIYFEDGDPEAMVHFFQFKFPVSLSGGLTNNDISAFLDGHSQFIGSKEKFDDYPWNSAIREKREKFDEIGPYKQRLYVMKYCIPHDSDLVHQTKFDERIKSLRQSTGNEIEGSIFLADKIAEMYRQKTILKWPSFVIDYQRYLSNFGTPYRTHLYFVPLFKLYKSVSGISGDPFKGNIRYCDKNSPINQAIADTLERNPEQFYLLNNGITIACAKVCDMGNVNQVSVQNGSIINGAQTIGTITSFFKNKLMEGVSEERLSTRYDVCFVFLKIIEIASDKEIIGTLVQTLNTQNNVRPSYTICNEEYVKLLQKSINANTDYFFELKENEFNYIQNSDPSFSSCGGKRKTKGNIIGIEPAIQAFVCYYDVGDYAYQAKNSKNVLFSDPAKRTIIDRLSSVCGDDYKPLLVSYLIYEKVMAVVSSYRSYRRDQSRNDILHALGVSQDAIDDYSFLTTGNLLLVFACGCFSRSKNGIAIGVPEVVEVTKAIARYIKEKLAAGAQYVPNLTRSKETFDSIRGIFENP